MLSVVERLSLPLLVAEILVNLSPYVVIEDGVVEFIDHVGCCRGSNQENDKGQETAQAHDRHNDGRNVTAHLSVAATGVVRCPGLASLWSDHCCGWLVRGSNDRRSRRNRNIGCTGGIRACLWL